MKLEIFDCFSARNFVPSVSTAVMRIYSENVFDNNDYGVLKESPLYIAEFRYVFDDIDSLNGNENPEVRFMSKDIARGIIRDFVSVRDRIGCLMIHCKFGQGRSPAVGMALNDVFDFGEDSFMLSKRHPYFNEGVYRLVFEAGEHFRSI